MGTVYEKHGKIEQFFSSQDPLPRTIRRPWTPIADFLTGVVERKESPIYDTAILMGWVKGLKHVRFKNDTVRSYVTDGAETHELEGTDNEIVRLIHSMLYSRNDTYLSNVRHAKLKIQEW
ncbi:MAG: hypothetical protein HY515_03280 [Candidatus Aenigmarchaeota archaeon]|nr:hypothetical protein [Candidatus Aenigmarchaeota archaeon]